MQILEGVAIRHMKIVSAVRARVSCQLCLDKSYAAFKDTPNGIEGDVHLRVRKGKKLKFFSVGAV